MFQCELRARPDVTFYWRNRYNIAELPYTLPCRKSSSAEHQSEGGHGPSKAIRARFSPAPITGEARSNRAIYIYISCRLERIYLSQFGRPQPPKVPVLSVGVRDELFGKFLRFFWDKTMQVFFIDGDLVAAGVGFSKLR